MGGGGGGGILALFLEGPRERKRGAPVEGAIVLFEGGLSSLTDERGGKGRGFVSHGKEDRNGPYYSEKRKEKRRLL